MAGSIIAITTVVVTVGFCVWFGIRVAERNRRYPRKIEYLEDGFVYHGDLGDTRVRWKDISSAEVMQETTKGYRGKYLRGKTIEFAVLNIVAGRRDFNIFAEDFQAAGFEEFIAALERARAANPEFRGIAGDIDSFRREIPPPVPDVDPDEESDVTG